MDWLTGNAFFIVVLVLCIVMHFFMHGGHGGHGGRDAHDGHDAHGGQGPADTTPRNTRPRA